MRKKPSMNAPEVVIKSDPDVITQVRSYRLITPLYGGGVEPNKADPISVVRGSEVRGHLRFWWRATQLGCYLTLDDLREGEERIWGSTNMPSKIIIDIRIEQPGTEEDAFTVDRRPGRRSRPIASDKIAAYAAFPLQPESDQINDPNWESPKVLLDVRFDLHLSYPSEFEKDIKDSLWAWETFGGIGARTRRGFGALKYFEKNGDEPLPDKVSFKTWLEKGLEDHTTKVENPIAGVPYLSRDLKDYIFLDTTQRYISCWKQLISLLQDFRQDKARFNNRFGLSLWPEANAIREMHGKDPKFPQGGNQIRPVNKFPRAKFGLPIIFHMPHDRNIPDGITLQGRKVDPEKDDWINRLASPIILKPVACSNDSCIGLVSLLQWKSEDPGNETYAPPGGLFLKGAPNNPRVHSDLNDKEINQISIIREKDILSEFYRFLKNNGGK
jgi:CRISPR-associated protein Cmr1